MKTPHLDIEIKNLENLSLTKNLTGLAKDALEEYKAIKEFIKENIKKETNKRYFIVFYNGNRGSEGSIGNILFDTENGFLSLNTVVKLIKENINLTECVITNIIELTEQDYNDWIK
jgi:hypothetical protein